ncbi:MAG: hypothetical protein HY443_01390 [Candidatus Nealsonbacteria bacterium]|nr:hypothetical protein [Candidatus Nealsonbacteria bacterium]
MKGYIAIISTLIISAVLLLATLAGVNSGIVQSKMAFQKNQFSENYYLAQACAEEALMRLKENSAYSGSETINLDQNSCQILFVEKGKSQARTVKVSGSLYNLAKKMKIEVSRINPLMEIQSWEELADF